MGVFEVTQRQWELVMGDRPSVFSNETCYATRPVESVSYVDIRGGVKGITWPESKDVDEYSFIGQLRKKAGLTGFDLPTEAQWEYACRAGTTTALNSGKNISTTAQCAEVDEVARYGYNSGWHAHGRKLSVYFSTNTTTVGTAVVGSYRPNMWGLYDMHGNVWECVLDLWNDDSMPVEAVNPVGPHGEAEKHCIKGASYVHPNTAFYSNGIIEYTSGHRSSRGMSIATASWHDVGFRLCLQVGEIPKTTAGTVLVNATGEGAANWTPTKAGTYYLAHETQTNGVNGAGVLGAWFMVGAPKLTFEPDGDLTPGVKVAIAGAGEDWTVRYEVSSGENGGVGTHRPTSESPEYTGPITLNDSVTIRAVAFSDGGLESLEYSATFSLMSVGGAVAKPRYPWSGKVDIDVTVKGAEYEDYLVSLVARDLDGSTNLPLRTAWQAGGTVTNNAFLVKPGTHRFTWDAAADITNDCEFANVVVNVSAEQSAIIAAKKVLTLEVASYVGSETLTNVPVLVRLSTSIDGFSYADFVDAKGGDLVFTDESGSVVYPHEIDEWHTDGESLVWVKLPRMVNGAKFKMAYGNSKLITLNSQLATHEVWRDYAGVWHMNEDSGTAFDSTVHGLDALPSCGTNGTAATMAQMVAYENGACGRARVNSLKLSGRGNDRQNFMLVPSYDGLAIGGRFVISGWFNGEYWNDGTSWSPRLISRKKDSIADSGWEICYRETFITISDDLSTSVSYDIPELNSTWVNLSVVYDEASCVCYTNGVPCGSRALSIESVDNGTPLAFGNTATGSRWSFIGQYDEIRLRGGTLSADRIKADYDMIVNRNFLRYGPVENGKGAAE